MGNPFYQPVSPADPPDHITPAGGVSNPSGYAEVTPHGQGPAPYDIQAEMPDVQSPSDAAVAVATGPRESEALSLLESPQGAGAFGIVAGFSGQPSETWANDMRPGANAETPDQGMGDFQGTTQEGLQKYGTT